MTWFFDYADRRKMVYTDNSGWYSRSFLLSNGGYSGFYDNENLLFDRFVRVFVLRPPSGEVQQRQKLGERSLAGYAGHRRFFDYPNGKRITYWIYTAKTTVMSCDLRKSVPSLWIFRSIVRRRRTESHGPVAKKIRKDNFGGLVSEPILNHKMNQYRYYVKF